MNVYQGALIPRKLLFPKRKSCLRAWVLYFKESTTLKIFYILINILCQRKYYIRQKFLFLLKKVLRFYRKSYFFKKKYYNKTESRIYLVQKVTIFSLFALLFFQKGKILTKNVFWKLEIRILLLVLPFFIFVASASTEHR